MILVRRAVEHDAAGCIDLLALLPTHFTPDTHAEAATDVVDHRAWVATDADRIVAFLIAEHRYLTTAEITFAAVEPERQGSGIGTQLVDTALAELADDGVLLVEVKTLDKSAGYEPYVATRAFWERRGFHQVDCIDPLPGWQPGNPSAIYVASLSSTRGGSC